MNESAAGVHLIKEQEESTRGCFAFPGTEFIAGIEVNGQRMGKVDFSINPLNDRVYIYDLTIEGDYWRSGLATATLWRLWCDHQVPLVPLHEVGTAVGFWSKARKRFAAAGVEIKRDIRTADHEEEKLRWQHLVPESEVERSVREYWAWVESEKAPGRPAGPGIR
ncbi:MULTISPECIES: N-acetyltransferase [unclassified Pseudomonas]|uniref:N-acetyltransferase n=1 Tax=unclassified Pseudomonas TaxID=196821 RepID=UPI002B23EA7C|nr:MULTISPECIES: N-acetyltransferase [unclassified Pseudomonas]MEA9979945.1 N-acetyltransferase [Pseudomonas sp. RTS4]MEB0198196.1 N-acetyltransferase [Pseudomonas sp. 5S4]MEB0247815.1 N-acetyltransferase [Pseudomonas sp. 10S5]